MFVNLGNTIQCVQLLVSKNPIWLGSGKLKLILSSTTLPRSLKTKVYEERLSMVPTET